MCQKMCIFMFYLILLMNTTIHTTKVKGQYFTEYNEKSNEKRS